MKLLNALARMAAGCIDATDFSVCNFNGMVLDEAACAPAAERDCISTAWAQLR